MGLREQGERSMPPSAVTWDITAISTPAHIQTAGKAVVPNESPESMTNNPSPPGDKSAIMQATLWGESQAWGMQQNVDFGADERQFASASRQASGLIRGGYIYPTGL